MPPRPTATWRRRCSMARRRASMREGPLAELFRATEAAQRQAEKEAHGEASPAPAQPEPPEETVEHAPVFDETVEHAPVFADEPVHAVTPPPPPVPEPPVFAEPEPVPEPEPVRLEPVPEPPPRFEPLPEPPPRLH